MKYEVIIFDADETLFDFRKSEREAFKNAMIEFDIEYDENHHLKIYSEINTAIWKEFEEGLITQEKLKVERFKRLSNKLEVTFDEIEFAKSYMKHLANASFLFEDSESLVESLYKDYKLAIVTNGLTDVQNGRIKKSAIAKYFQDVVISEEVKVAKPDPRIFELALNNLKYTDKSKVLMVGDSLSSDIRGGVNAGIDTCWYNPGEIQNTSDIKPTYEIKSLNELKDIING
ncbi:YjjG family noncanonical pyrimidine nucleotidase [Clostridium folliculivorans]|uniref:Haloacid dehalogenase n=1 Tax=Clostridium folliculivorans TaxID=2886038 RepID=A0A9W6DAA4_9CLOT|nr:YjjG family noncanonical pyrimidine nucleotidase [Clostridium folliculivorans]GKU25004.1 haloacid dehalogenase [Clostridium folliculivorans]GKU31102.1 haloacid dehalogenase [Clostridium folliculivorans]